MPFVSEAGLATLAFVFTLLIPLTIIPASPVSADYPDSVWLATNTGLYRSDDDGVTWQLNPVSAPGYTPTQVGNIPVSAVPDLDVASTRLIRTKSTMSVTLILRVVPFPRASFVLRTVVRPGHTRASPTR